MKRLLHFTLLILTLLLLVSIAPSPVADGEPLVEVSANRAEGTTGEPITWTVSLSGDWGSATCAYFLYRDMRLIDYQPASAVPFYQCTPSAPGLYSLSVCASDGTKSLFGSAAGVSVQAPLRIASVDANRPRILPGAVATWTARAEGGSGGACFGFFVYRDGKLLEFCVPDDPESGVLNYTPDSPGTYTVDVLASDAGGKAKMAGAPIVVTEGAAEPLAATSVFADAPDVLVGEEIVWTATASGGEETIAFSFFLYKDGELISFTPVGPTSVYRLTPAEPGVYAVSVHVSSGLEHGNLMSGSVTAVQPDGLLLTCVACDRSKAVLGESLTWTAQTEGASGAVLYSFALFHDWALAGLYETGNSPSFSFLPEEAGAYSVIAYAKDDARSASAPSADVRVASTGLSVDSVTTDQLTGVVGKPVTWTVHATGSENLRYMYFVYLNWELVYSSDVTTENAFTYTPTGSLNFYRYYIAGFVSDGEQTASFKSPVLPVAVEGRPRILSIAPDRLTAYPGEEITWTATVDYGADSPDPIGQIAFWLFLDPNEEAVNYTGYERVTSYSFAPTQPGSYLLQAAIDAGDDYLVAEAPVVRVIDPTRMDFGLAFEPRRLPEIVLDTAPPTPTSMPEIVVPRVDFADVLATPTPAPAIPEIVAPHVDFSGVLATTRPPMAPEKPKSTPTPAPTLNPDLPNLVKPGIHLP